MIDYGNILTIFYKNKSWRIENSIDYNTLNWYDSSPKPTKEELDSQWQEVVSIQKKENCKSKAKQLLLETDWSNLSDAQTQLDNYEEFVTYRKILRSYIINPVENPEFPIEPEARWKS